jgi:hypothetical protein
LADVEANYREYLLPNETLLFWTPMGSLEPAGGMNNLAKSRILTIEAGMYPQGVDHALQRLREHTGVERLIGTLLLTDKRLLLVGATPLIKKSIWVEILYDPDLAKHLIEIITEKDAEFVKKFHEGSFLSKMKMSYGMMLHAPVSMVHVLSDAWETKSLLGKKGVIIETSILWLFLGDKKDLVPQPVKRVTTEKHAVKITHLWNLAEGLAFASNIAIAVAMCVKKRTKGEEYDPILDIVEAKGPAMKRMISEVTNPENYPQKPPVKANEKQAEQSDVSSNVLPEITLAVKLEKIKALYESGSITKAEYDKQKDELLDEL